jgi:DNA recombination protein RmuC
MIVIRIFPTYSSFKEVCLKIDNIPYFYFFYNNPFYVQHAFVLFLFIIAYPLVFSLGAHFSARFRQKISLEEKLIAFSSQFNQLKEQLLNDKTIFEKQLENSIIEKKPSATKNSLAIQLSKKEVDFENLWERKQGTKKQ